MNNILKLRSIGTAIGGAVAGITGHHYGSKILSYKEDKTEEQIQTQRDEVLFNMKENIDKMANGLKEINDRLSKQQSEMESKTEDMLGQFKDQLKEVEEVLVEGRKSIEIGDQTLNKSFSDQIDDENIDKGMEYLSSGKNSLSTASNKISELLEKLNNKSKFLEELDLDLTSFYKYLDSLSLFEESAFFHIVFTLTIMCIVWNIYSVLFANEIIKYLNLENKYPKLNKFFKLRAQYQKYYLILNLILFLILCFLVLFLNILVLV